MKLSIIIGASLLIYSSAFAKIGWTLQECRNGYGPEVKSAPAWCGGTAYSFIHKGLYIYTIISNKVVTDVSYFDNVTGNKLSEGKCESLWLSNQNGRWDSGSASDWVNWNGRKSYKSLGRETGYEHIVQFSRDSNYSNVGNRTKEKGGYQVRTLKQFYAEQKVIKTLL